MIFNRNDENETNKNQLDSNDNETNRDNVLDNTSPEVKELMSFNNPIFDKIDKLDKSNNQQNSNKPNNDSNNDTNNFMTNNDQKYNNLEDEELVSECKKKYKNCINKKKDTSMIVLIVIAFLLLAVFWSYLNNRKSQAGLVNANETVGGKKLNQSDKYNANNTNNTNTNNTSMNTNTILEAPKRLSTSTANTNNSVNTNSTNSTNSNNSNNVGIKKTILHGGNEYSSNEYVNKNNNRKIVANLVWD